MAVQENRARIDGALAQIPCGLFVLTAAHGGVRSGVLTRWVQPCSAEPPHVMVAIPRGSPVEPLVRDSQGFALCQIAAGDRLLERCFSTTPGSGEDPFITLPAGVTRGGSPAIERAMGYLDCDLVRHVVLDGDSRIYVGLVTDAAPLRDGATPAVEVGGGRNGQVGAAGPTPTNGTGATSKDRAS